MIMNNDVVLHGCNVGHCRSKGLGVRALSRGADVIEEAVEKRDWLEQELARLNAQTSQVLPDSKYKKLQDWNLVY